MYSSLPIVATVLAFISIAASSPVSTKRDYTPPDRYYLQTKVVGDNSDSGTDKNGLWVYSSHTGAGLGDAGLSSNMTWAWEGYLNGTDQLFTYPNAPAPWPMAVSYGPYQAWNPVTISIAGIRYPGQGFFFNETGLQFNQSTEGWLACDWWHGAPQLFNVNGGLYGIPYPTSCSKVELYPVAI